MIGKRLLALMLCVGLLAGGKAGAITLYTASSFAGEDESASVYADLLRSFEETHDCVIQDRSSASSESWKRGILHDFAAGNEPDLLFFFAHGADSAPILNRVVPISRIQADYPEMHLPVSEALREEDGEVYAIPVRPFWEGLFCNTALFDHFGLPLPDTWAHLMEAVRGFRAQGIVPFAVSLIDAPHYITEMALLACATVEEQQARPQSYEEIPASWFRAMALLRELNEAGAFPDQAGLVDERTANALFRNGQAAIQVDGVWFAQQLTEEEMHRTAVLPTPAIPGNDRPEAYIGGVSMGFYLTRRAYEQPAVRELAVQLLGHLTSEQSRRRLAGSTLLGLTESTSAALTGGDRVMLSPVQDGMNAAAREVWLMECVPAVAEGSMTPEECWRRVMELHPFQ